MVQASVIREVMQPLYDMIGKENIPKETMEFFTFIMEESAEWANESEKLAEKQAQLNIEVGRLEGRRETAARFMAAFMETLKKPPATTP